MSITSEHLAALRARAHEAGLLSRPRILVGTATCGLASGAGAVLQALREAGASAPDEIDICEAGCNGACYLEPIVEVALPGKGRVLYSNVGPEDAAGLVHAALTGTVYEPRAMGSVSGGGLLLANAEAADSAGNASAVMEGLPSCDAHPFFERQRHIVMRNCGVIDPASLDEYVARGGYAGASRALLEMSPEAVIDTIKKSGLRGRGGVDVFLCSE